MKNLLPSCLVAASMALCGTALAQTWPAKPITFVVPQGVGTAVDSMSRLLAKHLGERLGQPIIVDNRPGASGNLGANVVAGAAPDGYTLLISANNLSIAPYVNEKLAWDPIDDFSPVAILATAPLVLTGQHSLNVGNMADLIAKTQSQPGRINFGTVGHGTPHHLAMLQLQQAAHVQFCAVPFKSMADLVTGLLGDQVQLGFASPGNVAGLATKGDIRLYAVSAPTRLRQAPDVPTLRELGFPTAETVVWVGVLAPANTPSSVVQRLSDEIASISKQTEYASSLDNLGFLIPAEGDSAKLAAQLREDKQTMPALLQAAGHSAGQDGGADCR